MVRYFQSLIKETPGILHRVSPTTAAPVRRRGDHLERALLAAAWDELVAVGYADLTIDAVAARARTSKSVLYRRWRNRPELVLAAMRQRGPLLSGEAPNTGSLRGDVLALLTRMSTGLRELRTDTIVGLFAEYMRNPELLEHLRRQVLSMGLEVMQSLLHRAAGRGEIPSADVLPRVASLPVDLLRHELLITRGAISEQTLAQIVDNIFLPLVGAHRTSPST